MAYHCTLFFLFFLLGYQVFVVYKVAFNLLNVHVAVQVVKLVANGSCKELFSLNLKFIHIKIEGSGLNVIGSCDNSGFTGD